MHVLIDRQTNEFIWEIWLPLQRPRKLLCFRSPVRLFQNCKHWHFFFPKVESWGETKNAFPKSEHYRLFFNAGLISAVVNNIEIMFGLTDRPFLRSSFEQIINGCPLHTPLAHLPKCTLFASPLKNILHNLCFSFLQDITAISREIEHNAYAKFWGANKVHYHNEFHLIF